MSQITVKSLKPNGFYEKTFDINVYEYEYEKFGDVAMEVMTRAVDLINKYVHIHTHVEIPYTHKSS